MTGLPAAAIVLAAGASSRLGEPKQLVQLDGETLLDRSIRVAREAGFAYVVVVLGANADEISARCALSDVTVARNTDWQEGMASSIRTGAAALNALTAQSGQPGFEGVLLMTCDQPAVTASHLRVLIASGTLCASCYAGRRGVPAYFPSSSLPLLQQLSGDSGARSLLLSADAVELPGGDLDIDTPADLAILLS